MVHYLRTVCFLDHTILWLLELTVNGKTYSNPFYGTVSFGNSAYPMWLFLVLGLYWDFLIIKFLRMKVFKSLRNTNVLDHEN